jgi:two-component system NtrC family sensor kinase
LANRTIIASTEVVPKTYLHYIDLEQQAAITLLETPKASPQPYDPQEGTAGLTLFSSAPILDPDGNLLGAAISFHLFNNDFTLVDQIKEAAQIDTVTIFLGDLRVSTNVLTESGERAVGTRLSEEVVDVVLRQGREYVGTAFVVTQNFITRYEPLRNHENQIVGILYVGALQSSFMNLLSTLNQQISLVATLTILMTFILATPVARMITRPLQELRELVKTSRRVADGDLNARTPVSVGGEVGLVASSFNTMLDTLQTTQDQLVHSEKLASLGQLAAGVAHELNNPLATILLYSETLEKEVPDDDPTQNDLKKIVSETKRCKRIVSDLLNFARQNQVIAQPTDIHAIIQNLLDMAPRRIKTVPVEFVTDLDPNLPTIEGDPSQLRQVLLNLMTNAVESMPEGGTVTVRTHKAHAGMITIDIQDTGVGIPPENLNKLFTPFFTTKPIGKGTGLGLAIVYGIIKMHRGQIHVSSKVNEGTTFTITLPVHLPPPERGMAVNPPPPPAGGEPLIG